MTISFAIFSLPVLASTLLSTFLMMQINVVVVTVWATGFLCLLNIALAIVFRQRSKREMISYWAACLVELGIFIFALLVYFGVITQVPYNLPPGLPIDRAQIGAALAIGIGLFPAAYWHRINISDLPRRISEDAKAMSKRTGGVQVRKGGPGEWMN